MNPRLCLCLLAIVVFLTEVEGWRRRRRRRCPRTNCSVSPWSSWSTCSKPCGTGGSQLRTRKVTKGATCGGSCSYPLKATRSCNTGCSGRGTALPGKCICKTGYSGLCCTGVDGGWSGWSSWRPCSKTCGVGKQDRVRTCTKPVPRTGGKPCPGASRVEQTCITRKCPVNGGLSKWSTWTTCTKTCGIGTQERSRSCTQPPPRYGGKPCLGTTREKRVCNTNPCPVDGGWSSWSGWKSCSKTCGTGNQDRVRTCTRPAPKNGGKPCPGAARDNRVCNTNACPVDGGWSLWSVWRRCSTTCGTGRQDRERSCTQPAPKYGGKPCRGPAREEQVCNTQSCPVDGNWSGWSSWRPCSKTCGSGKQFRSRSCTNPTPQNGGKTCRGEARDEQGCNTRPCPVDGGWSVWGAWSPCDKSCGGGFRQRTRSCVNPPPAFGGKGCGTANHESNTCNLDPCSVDGAWSNWGNWSECSVTCGTGARSRDRLCDNPLPAAGGKPCEGESQDSIPCTNGEVCLVGVGCYGNFPTLFPDFLGNFRDEIEWFAPSFADEMKKVVKKCGQLASKKRLRFFAVEDFGKCYGDLSQAYGFGSDSKSSRCNFGVGLPNYYYVYMLGA